MLTSIVVPGDKVELQSVGRLREDTEDSKRVYYSHVQDVLSADRMEILMPIEKSKLVLLPVDGVYDMIISTNKGMYQCMVRIIERYKSNNLYILVVELTSNLRRSQRREYFRLSCAINMFSRPLIEDEVKIYEETQKISVIPNLEMDDGVIVDISGGGLRFTTSKKYDTNSLVYCTYRISLNGELKEYEVTGRILSVKPVENRTGVYEHRIKYINLDVEKREEIIRYIFQEERKNRKKETGF